MEARAATMPTRPLGSSGIEVSVVGLGCNNFGGRTDLAGTRRVVDAALDGGVDFLDTADIYGGKGGSEEYLGEVIEGRRDRFVLGTKFGMDMGGKLPAIPRGSADYVRKAIDASLERLRTDWIDLYQYHQPDGTTPIEETLTALDELVRAGKVRAIGCSNFSAEQLEEAERVARERGLTPFVTVQNEYSLLEREIEAEVVPAAERLGVGVIPYFPLAHGLLTGKYRRGAEAPEGTRLHGRARIADDETFDKLEALEQFARVRELSVLDVAIGALAAQPQVVSVIAGATKPAQIESNAAAARWTPSSAELAEIDRIFPSPPG